MKTAGELKRSIRDQVFPSGEAENLVSAHNWHFQEAFAEISKWVECEQENNVNTIAFCKTFTKCGMTVFPAPAGVIKSVYTIANGQFCDSVEYRMVDWPEPQWFGKRLLAQLVKLVSGNTSMGLGFLPADASNDAIGGRARAGIFSLNGGNIYLAPWIQSNESVVIEWSGIKHEWTDNDLVNEALDYRKAVMLYFKYCHERDFGSIQEALLIHNPQKTGTFDEALADLMWQCRENTRTRETAINPDQRLLHGSDVLTAGLPPDPETPMVIAQIGNWGEVTTNSTAVAALVENLAPNHVVTSGNNAANVLPDAPVITAEGSDGEVSVSWTSPTGAISFDLFRSESPNTGYQNIADDSEQTTYTDTNVVNGTSYYYKVVASGIGGEGDESNVAAATPAGVQDPCAGVSESVASLAWTISNSGGVVSSSASGASGQWEFNGLGATSYLTSRVCNQTPERKLRISGTVSWDEADGTQQIGACVWLIILSPTYRAVEAHIISAPTSGGVDQAYQAELDLSEGVNVFFVIPTQGYNYLDTKRLNYRGNFTLEIV